VTAGPAEPEVKRESWLGRFLRRSLRWATATVAVFALGVAATWLTQVRPRAGAVETLEQGLATVEAQRNGLQAEVDDLSAVRAENEALRAQLEQAEARLLLRQVLMDVSAARLALAEQDPAAAAAALEETSAALNGLGVKLGPGGAATVAPLHDRLLLALQEMETDGFAAQRDLEVLANSLLEIEGEQFGE
jgi:hypothetical protein